MGPDRAGGDSAHRPPLATSTARGQTFLSWPWPSTTASTNQEKSFRPSGESHSGLVPVPVRRNQPSYTERTKKMNSESIKKVTNQAIEQLVEALNAGHSEALTQYLAAMAKFRAYSFLNVLLILKQCPNAGRVAGYRTWHSFGRQVRQGEKGIMILAPIFRKRTETADQSHTTDESRKVAGFRGVYVWDEQQTRGKELPQIGSVKADPSFYLARLQEFVRAIGIRLVYSADIAPPRGIAEKGKITLLPDQTPAETYATLVHELA